MNKQTSNLLLLAILGFGGYWLYRNGYLSNLFPAAGTTNNYNTSPPGTSSTGVGPDGEDFGSPGEDTSGSTSTAPGAPAPANTSSNTNPTGAPGNSSNNGTVDPDSGDPTGDGNGDSIDDAGSDDSGDD